VVKIDITVKSSIMVMVKTVEKDYYIEAGVENRRSCVVRLF